MSQLMIGLRVLKRQGLYGLMAVFLTKILAWIEASGTWKLADRW